MGGFRFWEAFKVQLINLDLLRPTCPLTTINNKTQTGEAVQRRRCCLVIHVPELSQRSS